jgi:hypothetical protein
MWLITPIGFFSIVEKPTDRKSYTLTIRARVKSDLVALRREFLPSLGRVRDSTDTDYRYRATAARADVGGALAQMVARLGYSNFKTEVAVRQGVERAHVYHDVWEVLHDLQNDPKFEGRPINRRLPK